MHWWELSRAEWLRSVLCHLVWDGPTATELRVTWLSDGLRSCIICINFVIYILFDSFYHYVRAGSRALRHGTIREDSPPTLGATLPRTEVPKAGREPCGMMCAVHKAGREPWCTGRFGLEPLSYWSGRTIEFSPAHEGRDWLILRHALYDYSYFICLVDESFLGEVTHGFWYTHRLVCYDSCGQCSMSLGTVYHCASDHSPWIISFGSSRSNWHGTGWFI